MTSDRIEEGRMTGLVCVFFFSSIRFLVVWNIHCGIFALATRPASPFPLIYISVNFLDYISQTLTGEAEKKIKN